MNVLITDDVHVHMLDTFREWGWDYIYRPDIKLEDTIQLLPNYSGVVINSKTILTKDTLSKCNQLKWIARLGSGMEIVDVDYAESKGIRCISAPEGNCNAVAEHALGFLLMLINNIHKSANEVKNKQWIREENRGIELSALKVGIIGFGHTGKAFAEKLVNLGVQVFAHDKYKSGFESPGIKECELEEIQNVCNVISFHLPLTEECTRYADATFWRSCKNDVYVINTARGKIFNYHDLIQALDNQKIVALAADVFENEKLTTHNQTEQLIYENLTKRSNVVLTPHVAGWTVQSKRRITEILLKKLNQFVKIH